MGLHLNYELRLPRTARSVEVEQTLLTLRRFAVGLPFDTVSRVIRVDGPSRPRRHSSRGLLQFMASIVAEPWEDDDPPLTGDVPTAQGFVVWPGRRCEPAFFAFLYRSDAEDRHAEWFWHCSCKTQYASVVSDEHLVTCHTSLVAVLDRAIALGVDVVVRDETHYWETRDRSRLISEVHAMNRVVARFAGRFSDTVGDQLGVVAPIFDHARFEHLETGEE